MGPCPHLSGAMAPSPHYSAGQLTATIPKIASPPRPLLGCLVADDAGGQHDVAGPAAGAAEADEDPAAAGPVLADKALSAVGQRQGRRAPRAVPGRVAPVPFGIDGKPAPPDVAAGRDAVTGRNPGTGRHPAAAFPFSCALMCSFFSASACGLNRDEARSMNWIANDPPASNLFFSHGRSIRSCGSRTTPSGSSPRDTRAICSLNIRRSIVTPTSERPRCSTVRSVIGPWVTHAIMSWPST